MNLFYVKNSTRTETTSKCLNSFNYFDIAHSLHVPENTKIDL